MPAHRPDQLQQISALNTSIVEAVVAVSQGLHGSGTFPEAALRAVAHYAVKHRPKCSVETGSGASTLLLSHLSERHITFSIDSGSGSLTNVKNSPLFRSETVTIVEGPTQLTLPRYRFAEPVQLALIDGPHGYPFPDLEYYYIYPQIQQGGILIVDDIQIPTIRNMFEFLSADDMWKLEEVVETTAFFTRTDATTFSPTGDSWWLQKYNTRK